MKFVTTSLTLRGALLGLAAMAAFGVNDLLIKGLGAYNPFQIMFFSGVALMPLLVGKMALDRGTGHYRPVMPGWMALRCAINLVNTVLVVYAFGNMSLAQAYAIFFTMPLLVTLLAAYFLREPISLGRGLAVAAGFVGVLIALQPGRDPMTWAHLAALIGVICAAVNFFLLRKTAPYERQAVQIIYPSLTQLTAAAIALPFVYQPMPMLDMGLALVMAVCGFAGSLMIIAAYRAAPAIVVSPMQYSQIIWAALAATFIFEEVAPPSTWAGLLVIVGAGLYILYSAKSPTPIDVARV